MLKYSKKVCFHVKIYKFANNRILIFGKNPRN